MLSFCLFSKTEGFHSYFLQIRKTFSFADRTEAFLSLLKRPQFFLNRRISRFNQHVHNKGTRMTKILLRSIFVIERFKLFICFLNSYQFIKKKPCNCNRAEFSVRFLEELKARKFAFEIFWPSFRAWIYIPPFSSLFTTCGIPAEP